MTESLNPQDFEAAARLATSSRLRALWFAIASMLWSALMGAAGWVSSKIDTRAETVELSKRVELLTSKIETLTAQSEKLSGDIGDLSRAPKDGVLGDHGGQIFVLTQEMKYAQHNIVAATAMALSYEAERRKKQEFAKQLSFAYDQKVWRDNKLPSEAAEMMLTQVAVP